MMDMQSALQKAGFGLAMNGEPIVKPERNIRIKYRKERFSAEFKRRAVDRVREVGNVGAVAREMQIQPSTLHTWVYIVEHGGKLEPSAGWEPSNGDRFYAKNPANNPTGANHTPTKNKYPEEIVDLIVNHAQTNGALMQGYPEQNQIYTAEPRQPSILETAVAEMQKAQSAGKVPYDYARLRRLEAENEALRQIVRGFQALLNLL